MTRLGSALAIAGLTICSAASAQLQRTFVTSFGDDANACSFGSPCRSFAAAEAKTLSGGEIIARDAAGFGPVTITKSLSIIANPGSYAGITASSGAAVTIATAGVNVILRGLNLNGIGAAYGVAMTDGASLTIENCVISNFFTGILVNTAADVRVSDSAVRSNNTGISISAGASGDIFRTKTNGNSFAGMEVVSSDGLTTKATVSDSESVGNSFYGYFAISLTTGTSQLTVSRSTASNNGSATNPWGGIVTRQDSGTVQVWVNGSTLSGNYAGIYQFTGTVSSLGNNAVRGNVTDVVGTVTAAPQI